MKIDIDEFLSEDNYPYNMIYPITIIASAHLSACIPNFMILEYQMGDVP